MNATSAGASHAGPVHRPRLQASALHRRLWRRGRTAGLTLLLCVAALDSSIAQATAPPPFPALDRVVAAATSYQVDTTVTTIRSTAQHLLSQFTITMVRTGKTRRLHMEGELSDQSGGVSYTDIITDGTHLCLRMSSKDSYTCITSAEMAAKLLDDPTQEFLKPGLFSNVRPVGPKSIHGQECDGYAYIYRSPVTQTRGTLYVSHRTSVPCEQDDVGTSTLAGQTVTARTVATWSRFNDPTLTIPNVSQG